MGAGLVGEDDGDDFSASDFVPSEPEDSLSALPHPATTVAVATTRPTIARMLLAKHASASRGLSQGAGTVTCLVTLCALPQPSVVVSVTVYVPSAGNVRDDGLAEVLCDRAVVPKSHR